jgi:uncharacterized membrane protein
MRPIQKVVLGLIVLNIIFTILLFYSYETNTTVCATGFDCDAVKNSSYSKIFGISLSTLGIISFPALLIIFLLGLKNKKMQNLFYLSTLIGAIGASRFLYIQFFILKKVCSSCLAIDSLMIIIFIFSAYDWYKNR